MLFFTAVSFSLAQNDSCDVQQYVRADGVMIRGVSFEPIYEHDSLTVSAAMYAIDKDYFLVVRIVNDKRNINYSDNISIQLSDSTNILLSFDSFKNDRSKKSYDGYFKINSSDLGYMEKFGLVKLVYTINKEQRTIPVQRNADVLQRHFACLRNTK